MGKVNTTAEVPKQAYTGPPKIGGSKSTSQTNALRKAGVQDSLTTLGQNLNKGLQNVKAKIQGLVNQFVDKIRSISGRASKTFKANKYVKKLRSREEMSKTVKALVTQVKELNSVEAIRKAASELRVRLTGEDGVLRHFKSRKAFFKLLEPLN